IHWLPYSLTVLSRMRWLLVVLSTMAIGCLGGEEHVLGSVYALAQSSFVELTDADFTEFNASPLRALGKPTFVLGNPNFVPKQSNFSVVSGGDKEIRRAPATGNIQYSFPPPTKLPLPSCFYNPAGYVCCNRDLYHFIEDSFRALLARPGFNPCNIQSSVNSLHRTAEQRFNVSMEAVVGLDDFAQKVRFRGSLACKLEVEGKYIMMYATPTSSVSRRKRETSDADPANIENEHAAFF
ncbi:hypothetical protein PENTCL1PPCAC_26572, partial [Pristionchus entomophagus]